MKVQIPELKREIKIVSAQAKPIVPHVYFDEKFPLVRINHPLAVKYDYNACPSVNSFLHDKSCNNKIIIGAYGSGKSSAILQYLLWRAVTMPMCDDGVRRYKALIVRSSTPQLESTTLQSWLRWSTYLPPAIGRESNKLSQNKEYRYQIYDEKGMIDFVLYFLPLDSEKAGEKLDSFEATDVFINEVRHIPQGIWRRIFYRAGRYPDKLSFNKLWNSYRLENKITNDELSEEYKEAYKKWFPFKKQQICDSNAPSKRHWICKLDEKRLDNRKIYHQPPQILKDEKGKWHVNPAADNIKYREWDNWLDMAENEGDDFALVYACGYYGLSRAGKAVYPQFSQTLHVKKGVKPVEDVPLLLTFDMGMATLAPGALIQQLTPLNQYRAIKEFCADRSSAKSLAEDVYLWLVNNYPEYELFLRHDPAAEAGKDVKDLKVQTPAILKEIFGVESLKAKTNQLQPRVDAPKHFLSKLCDNGEPAFIVDEDNCPILIEALVSEYYYEEVKVIGENRVKDKPKKSHPHCEPMDCCQYGCLEYGGAGIRQNSKKAYNINYKQFLAHNTVM